MKKQKYLVSVVCGILVAGGLAGCGMSAAQSGGAAAAPGISPQETRVGGGLPGAREPQAGSYTHLKLPTSLCGCDLGL